MASQDVLVAKQVKRREVVKAAKHRERQAEADSKETLF
jgi:hypothetical protein